MFYDNDLVPNKQLVEIDFCSDPSGVLLSEVHYAVLGNLSSWWVFIGLILHIWVDHVEIKFNLLVTIKANA